MATPKYFSNFPNIDYALKMNKAGIVDYITVKDYFHLLVTRDDIRAEKTIYSPYVIKNGERPDQIAYKEYGDEQYYWIILQVNEITDYYSEWPLSQYELDEYIIKKYGLVGAEEVRHYETLEIKNEDGIVIVPGRGAPDPNRGGLAQQGLRVPEDYTVTIDGKTYKGPNGPLPACTPITNRQHEYDLNEDKGQIFILQKKYIKDYMFEIRRYIANLPKMKSVVDVSDFDN